MYAFFYETYKKGSLKTTFFFEDTNKTFNVDMYKQKILKFNFDEFSKHYLVRKYI